MKTFKKTLPWAAALCAAAAAPASVADTFAIDWWTLDGGGGASSSATFQLQGTIAQPDADPLQPASSTSFELVGGFWTGGAEPPPFGDAVFSNGFE